MHSLSRHQIVRFDVIETVFVYSKTKNCTYALESGERWPQVVFEPIGARRFETSDFLHHLYVEYLFLIPGSKNDQNYV